MIRDLIRTVILVAVLVGVWATTFDSRDVLEFRMREMYNNGHVQHPLAYSHETGALPFQWDPVNYRAIPDVQRVMTHLKSRTTPTSTLISAQEYGVSLDLVYIRSIDDHIFNMDMVSASTNMFTCKMQSGGQAISIESPERVTIRYIDLHGAILTVELHHIDACAATLYLRNNQKWIRSSKERP